MKYSTTVEIFQWIDHNGRNRQKSNRRSRPLTTISISLKGIDQAIDSLNYRPGSVKQTLIYAIRAFYTSEESIKDLKAIETDTLIRSIWNIELDSKIKTKRRNFSSLKSSVNSDLKKLSKKGLNPENIIIRDTNTFDMSEEAKNDLLSTITNSANLSAINLDQAGKILGAVTEFLENFQGDDPDTNKEEIADQIKKILNKITTDVLTEEQLKETPGLKEFNTGSTGLDASDNDNAGEDTGDDIEEIELTDDEILEEIVIDDEIEPEEDEEIELDEDEDFETIEIDEDEALEEVEDFIDETEDLKDEAPQEIDFDEDEDLEIIEIDEDEEVEELVDEEEDIEDAEEFDDSLDIEDSDERETDSFDPGAEDEFEEIEIEDEDLEEITLDGEADSVGPDGDRELDEIELEDDEELETIEIDEDEEIVELEEIVDETDGTEDIEEIELEEDEEIEEIDLDEDEDLEDTEEIETIELDDDELEAFDDFREQRNSAEQFDGVLGEREKKYNTYVLVPEGQYTIGTKKDIKSSLELQQFDMPKAYMGAYPVTNSLFEIFIDETGYVTTAEALGFGRVYYSRFQKRADGSTWLKNAGSRDINGACWYQPSGPESSLHGKRNHPVVQVSAEDATAFASWIGRRLPTEAEWEAAARTDVGYDYPWGDEFNPDALNIEQTGQADTSAVDTYDDFANPFKIADLMGNVMEWTSDMEYPSISLIKPVKHCVAKGVAWNARGESAISSRTLFKPGFTSNTIGFRCMSEVLL